jgi:hypothetical protein
MVVPPLDSHQLNLSALRTQTQAEGSKHRQG